MSSAAVVIGALRVKTPNSIPQNLLPEFQNMKKFIENSDYRANSVDSDELALYELPYLDWACL